MPFNQKYPAVMLTFHRSGYQRTITFISQWTGFPCSCQYFESSPYENEGNELGTHFSAQFLWLSNIPSVKFRSFF